MAGSDIDCVVIGEGGAPLEETLQSLSEAGYYRGAVHLFVVGGERSEAASARFPGVTFISEATGNRAKARNVGWDRGSSPLVQFLESGDRINPEWFQRATKEIEGGVAAICGQIVPTNPDKNRWHRIAYLDSKADLAEGRLLDLEPLLRREMLEETGGYNESLPHGGALEFNARLTATGRRVIHLNFPMAERQIHIPNWKGYWKEGVKSGYRVGAAFWRGRDWTLVRQILGRGLGALFVTLLALLGLFVTPLTLFFLLPAAILLLWPRIFETERVAKQEGFSHEDSALYTWHRSLLVLPQLWGMLRYLMGRVVRP
ncbi:MAG: glycosyltransferase [Parachlamydiales bacterium]